MKVDTINKTVEYDHSTHFFDYLKDNECPPDFGEYIILNHFSGKTYTVCQWWGKMGATCYECK